MWRAIAGEYTQWAAAGLTPQFWLRDDDAMSATLALERLTALCEKHSAPVLLAVIPIGADATLARHIAQHPLLHPCQHGFAHFNHASRHEKKQELGPHRAMPAMMAELAAGRARLKRLFGAALRPVLVPPWNRIAPQLIPCLPNLDLTALSAFGAPAWPNGAPLRIDSHIDLVDWRHGRAGLSSASIAERLLAALILARRHGGAPIGVLSHHLVHDAQAWRALEDLLAWTCDMNAEAWIGYEQLAGMAK